MGAVDDILSNYEQASKGGKFQLRSAPGLDLVEEEPKTQEELAVAAGVDLAPPPSLTQGTPNEAYGRDFQEREGWLGGLWKKFTYNELENQVREQNAQQISLETGMPISRILNNYQAVTRDYARSKGVATDLTNREYNGMMMALGILPAISLAPAMGAARALATGGYEALEAYVAPKFFMSLPSWLKMGAGVGGYMGVAEAENYLVAQIAKAKGIDTTGYQFGAGKEFSSLFPEASEASRTFMDFIDMVGKVAFTGVALNKIEAGFGNASHFVKENYLRDTFTEYRMPEKTYFSADKMRDFFGTGENISPQEYDLIQSLGLDAAGYKDAIKYGVDVEIPAERLVRVVDKPWWGKMKEMLRLSPYEEIRMEGGGDPTIARHVSGQIEGPPAAEEAARSFSEMLKDFNEALGEVGAIGEKELTLKQKEARERLRKDFDVMKKKAQEAGQDVADFMKNAGLDEKAIGYMVSEFGKQAPKLVIDNKDPYVEVMDNIDQPVPDYPTDFNEIQDPKYEQIYLEAKRVAWENFQKRVDLRQKKQEAMLRKAAEQNVKDDPLNQVVAEGKNGGINQESLLRDYDAETVKALTQRYPGLVKKDGPHRLDVLAADNGFEDGDTLINLLLGNPKKAEAVAREVKSFKDMYGEELEADVSDLYVRMIDEELKIMRRLTAEYKPRPATGLKKFIREETGQVRVGDVVGEYDALKAGMKKAEQASALAWREGRKLGAIEQKEKQLELANLVKFRTLYRQEVNKIHDSLVKVLKNKNIPPEYQDRVQELLRDYDLMPRGPKTQVRIDSLRDFLARHEETGEFGGAIANSLIDRVNKVPWRELSLGELQDLHDAAQMIVHLGKLKNELIASKERREFLQAMSRVINTITVNYPLADQAKTEILISQDKTMLQRLSDGGKRYRAELIKPEYIFRRLDKFKDLGTVWTECFKPFVDAENLEIERGKQLTSELLKAFEPFTEGFFSGSTWAAKKHRIPGLQTMLTKEQMIMVALNSGNEGNVKALMGGNGFTIEHIQAIVDALTPEEFALVREIWRIINSLFPETSDVYRELTGARLRKVEGDYFPLKFDRELSFYADKNQAEAEARDFFKSIYTKPSVEKGFTKERVGGKDPVLLKFSVIFGHINDVVHYNSHALAIRDVMKIISNPAFRTSVIERLGQEMYDQITPWLQEIAKPRREPICKLEKWVDILRKNTTVVGLGLKFSVAAQQPLSLTQAIEELGVYPVLESVAKFYAGMPSAVSFVNERSPMMGERMNHWDREVESVHRKMDPAAQTLRNELTDASFLLIGLLDVASAYPTWMAAYKLGMEQKFSGNEQKAIDYADMIVRKTQATTSPKDMAAIQRGSGYKKLATMFYTFFSAMQNQLMERGAQLKAGDKSIFGWMKAWWWVVIFPAVMSDIIKERRLLSPKETVKSIVTYRLAGLPGIRDVVSASMTNYDYTFSPVFKAGQEMAMTLKEGVKGVENMAGVTSDRGDLKKFMKHGFQTVGYLAGLPTAQVAVTAQGISDLYSGKTKDPTRLLMRESERPSR